MKFSNTGQEKVIF